MESGSIHGRLGDWVTAQEAARIKRVSPESVYKAIRSNKLPGSQKVGRMWLIPRAAVDAWRVFGHRPPKSP